MTLAIIKHWSACRNRHALRVRHVSFNTHMVVVCYELTPAWTRKQLHMCSWFWQVWIAAAALYLVFWRDVMPWCLTWAIVSKQDLRGPPPVWWSVAGPLPEVLPSIRIGEGYWWGWLAVRHGMARGLCHTIKPGEWVCCPISHLTGCQFMRNRE